MNYFRPPWPLHTRKGAIVRHKRTPTKAGVPRQRQHSQTRANRWAASLAVAVIVAGGGAALAAPATAAPTDPITMPDNILRACINADLGQGATDPITEAQAATVATVDCQTMGITDITGLETMPNLETVRLNNNSLNSRAPLFGLTKVQTLNLSNTGVTEADLPGLITLPDLDSLHLVSNNLEDISALASATSLRVLYLSGNNITDLSPLTTLTGLTVLHLANNQISDVLPLSTLTGLTNLYLGSNEIADASPLSSLTSLTALQLTGQSLDLPSAPLGAPTTNPVTNVAGDPVPVTSTDTGFTYDSAADTWSFSSMGNKSLTWDTTVTIGSATDVQFSGTISQRISFAHAVPEDPTVIQAVCVNGDVVYPQITLPDTEGIHYTVIGDVAPGATVTIEAVPADEDHAIYVDPASDWVDASGDHIYATLEVTLDDADCESVDPEPTVIDPPNGDLPINDTCGPDNAVWILPTGDDVTEGFTWRVADDGLLIAEANEGYVFGDASSDLDPMFREYGYAPDSGEACPTSPETPQTPEELSATGGTAPVLGGAAAALLLGSGLFLLLTRRSPRDA